MKDQPNKVPRRQPRVTRGANAETENPNINIRLLGLREPLNALSERSGVPLSEIIRMCVHKALPIVNKAFDFMDEEFAKKLKETGR